VGGCAKVWGAVDLHSPGCDDEKLIDPTQPGPGPYVSISSPAARYRAEQIVESLTFSGGVNPTSVNDKVSYRDGIGQAPRPAAVKAI
jgi:hypothetical protein